MHDWDNVTPLWAKYNEVVGASRHMTNVFNVFVIMQVFNMLNTRKINDELNVFDGLSKNPIFCILWVSIFGA